MHFVNSISLQQSGFDFFLVSAKYEAYPQSNCRLTSLVHEHQTLSEFQQQGKRLFFQCQGIFSSSFRTLIIVKCNSWIHQYVIKNIPNLNIELLRHLSFLMGYFGNFSLVSTLQPYFKAKHLPVVSWRKWKHQHEILIQVITWRHDISSYLKANIYVNSFAYLNTVISPSYRPHKDRHSAEWIRNE